MPRGPLNYSKAEYCALLRTARLPDAPQKKVGIVGAGISGLVAGWLLKQAGHRVRLFEASRVVGGRIKTLRDGFSGHLYAEAGAMRVPISHSLTRSLIDLFGLPTHAFPNTCDNALYHVHDRHITVGKYKEDPHALELPARAATLFSEALIAYVTTKPCLDWPAFSARELGQDDTQPKRDREWRLLRDLDRYSLRHFLNEHVTYNGCRLTPKESDMMCFALSFEMDMAISMAEMVYHLRNEEPCISIVGGMDRLPKAFVNQADGPAIKHDLADAVSYSCRVVEIRAHTARPLTIRWENPITRRLGSYDCDIVIITLPFSALQHIHMPALLSEDKARAIRQLHYQNACKVFIEFTQRFWTRSYPGLDAGAKPITGGYSVTDLPVREIWYPSEEHIKLHTMGRPGGVLLASYTWGDDSLRWTALRRDDRIRFALRDLAMVHNREPHPGGRRVLEEIFVGGLSHSWAEDEFTSGAFANFEPFQLTELFEYIWRPENVGPDDEPVGSIHYCGEHTSLRHGWIEGAVESAIRVAKEICDTYAHDRQRS